MKTNSLTSTHLVVSGSVCFLALGAIFTTLHGVGKLSIPGISKGPEGILTLIKVAGTIVALILSAHDAVKALKTLKNHNKPKPEPEVYDDERRDVSESETDENQKEDHIPLEPEQASAPSSKNADVECSNPQQDLCR